LIELFGTDLTFPSSVVRRIRDIPKSFRFKYHFQFD
jgi:hypothetical protein